MSDFAAKIRAIGARVIASSDLMKTEEATKTSAVLPLIAALGYDFFDPSEVVPEFTADVGIKKGEKVDYALMVDGKPVILIECKTAGTKLGASHFSQLFRYFAVTSVRVAVLTNGLDVWLFSDLDEPNKMDAEPFLKLDISSASDAAICDLSHLSKSSFDIDKVIGAAKDARHINAIKGFFSRQMAEPDEDFARFVVKRLNDSPARKPLVDQFVRYVPLAFNQFVNDQIRSRLNLSDEPVKVERVDVVAEASGCANDIVTTEEEAEGVRIVKAICANVVSTSRVVMKDVKSYCGVLLDNNNRRPICRLYFNTKQKHLGTFNAQREETKIPIVGVEDIYLHADAIRDAVKLYAASDIETQ